MQEGRGPRTRCDGLNEPGRHTTVRGPRAETMRTWLGRTLPGIRGRVEEGTCGSPPARPVPARADRILQQISALKPKRLAGGGATARHLSRPRRQRREMLRVYAIGLPGGGKFVRCGSAARSFARSDFRIESGPARASYGTRGDPLARGKVSSDRGDRGNLSARRRSGGTAKYIDCYIARAAREQGSLGPFAISVAGWDMMGGRPGRDSFVSKGTRSEGRIDEMVSVREVSPT